MLSEAKHLGFSVVTKTRFFAGVYPEFLEGAQNDILRECLAGKVE
jgi:hypothetical protein